jgi:hypothetical protein
MRDAGKLSQLDRRRKLAIHDGIALSADEAKGVPRSVNACGHGRFGQDSA